jgi:hypothetical protein
MSLWNANASYLKQSHPELWARLPKQYDISRFQIVSAKRSGVTLFADGKPVHSKYHPLKEATAILSSATRDAPEQAVSFHFGFGMGYLLEAEPEEPRRPIIIFEPQIAFFVAALHVRAIQPLLETHRVSLCFDLDQCQQALRDLGDVREAHVCFASLPYHQNQFAALLKQTMALLGEELERHKVRHKTLENIYPRAVLSTLRSLPHALHAPSAAHLRPCLRGKPAVVVSAGPSLEHQLELLERMQEHVVIFAVSRTLNTLLERGITPHFFVHNEAQDYRGFIDQLNLEPVHALLADQCHDFFYPYPTASVWGYSNMANSVSAWLEERFPAAAKMHADTGGSVANDAFSLAVGLGCHPIVLVGQDLAFRNRTIYADTRHNHDFDFEEALLRNIPGYWGTPVTTSVHYRPCIRWYADAVTYYRDQEPRLQFFNATAGGAHLQGFEQVSLAAFASKCMPIPELRQQLGELAQDQQRMAHRVPLEVIQEQLKGQCKAVRRELEPIQSRVQNLIEKVRYHIRDLDQLDKAVAECNASLEKLSRLTESAPVPGSLAYWLREPDLLKVEASEGRLREWGLRLAKFADQVADMERILSGWPTTPE